MLMLLIWVFASACQDLRQRQISNHLVYPYLLLAVAWLIFTGQSLAGASPTTALVGLACALALTIPGHIKGVLGGGDVKLMAGIGLTLGGMATLLLVAIAALWLVVWMVVAQRLPASTLNRLQRYTPGLDRQQGHFAYGPFVFLALASLYAAIRLQAG